MAYGRRHMDLLTGFRVAYNTIVPVHTILEIYHAITGQLVTTMHSSEDEVNVSIFHPHAGGGYAYGTKEGKLGTVKHVDA